MQTITIKQQVRQKRAPVEAGVTVKFGLDVHAAQITVCRQIDGQVPQPAQRFGWAECVEWIEAHVKTGAEQRRAVGRQRDTLVRERQRCVVRGHGLLLAQGVRAPEGWWQPKVWAQFGPELPEWLRAQLQVWQENALRLEEKVNTWTTKVVAQAPDQPTPKGVGELTAALLAGEVLDWHRFQNRRQVASYTGLCPSEHSSGENHRQGGITKHGNPRVRHHLVEAVWRLLQWQPDYPPLKKLRAATGKRTRKRLAVAAARRLAIDLWRINTGQCPAEKLGLKLR